MNRDAITKVLEALEAARDAGLSRGARVNMLSEWAASIRREATKVEPGEPELSVRAINCLTVLLQEAGVPMPITPLKVEALNGAYRKVRNIGLKTVREIDTWVSFYRKA